MESNDWPKYLDDLTYFSLYYYEASLGAMFLTDETLIYFE